MNYEQLPVLLRAEEVGNIAKCSASKAYKIMKDMNKRLEKEGFTTINSRVSKKFFFESLGLDKDNFIYEIWEGE